MKKGLIAWACILGIFLIALIYVKANNNFEVVHYPEAEQTVGEDGRYVAGNAEFYEVYISPALNWEMGKGKAWRVVFWIVMLAVGGFMVLWGMDKIGFTRTEGNYILFISLAIAAASLFASYSAALGENKLTLTPEKYKVLKDDKGAIKAEFELKEYVR